MSIDFKRHNILCTNIHPGWTKTDMGGENAPLEVKTSVSSMLETLSTLSEKDNGTFIQYDGKQLPY